METIIIALIVLLIIAFKCWQKNMIVGVSIKTVSNRGNKSCKTTDNGADAYK